MNTFFVYFIYSNSCDIYYKGFTTQPILRLEQHNNNTSDFTSGKGPWVFVFIQSFDNKTAALKREKVLKKYSKKQIENLINTPLNEINYILKKE